MAEIQWIIFDVGNVLIELRYPELIAQLAKLSQRSAVEVKAFVDQWGPPLARGAADTGDLYQAFSRFAADGVTLSEFEEAVCAELGQEMPELAGLLPQLKQRARLACLSNTIAIHWPVILRRYSFFEHLEATFASYQIGLAKPDPQIFRFALAELGAVPEQCLFIDDLAENTESAADLGFVVHQFNNWQDCRQFIGRFL